MYMTPSRGGGTPHGRRKTIPDGPLSDFCDLIEHTPSDQWQKRSAALRKLVDSIPEGHRYAEEEAWYNTPAVLRHLANSVGELVKDPRSTVVKRTCECLTGLFNKCQSDGRYLFKDLMPTILSVHAQTVQVIRTAVQDMVVETIPEVPCKMVMPLWMERLKVDRSRTVREACALYIGHALRNWTEEGYLTDEIWMQVGTTLVKTLRDPSPNVRTNAKSALETIRSAQPAIWTRLVEDDDSPVARDPKLQRWLKSLGADRLGDAEELSVASRFSYNSDTRYAAARHTAARGSPASRRQYGLYSDNAEPSDVNVPMSIEVTSPVPQQPKAAVKKASALGPALRVSAGPFANAIESPQRPLTQTATSKSTPPRHPTPTSTHRSPAASSYLGTIEDNTESQSNAEDDLLYSSSFPSDLNHAFGKSTASASSASTKPTTHASTISASGSGSLTHVSQSKSSDSNEDGPFIASMQQLKLHASKRRSRNSLMMQERFRMSGSFVDEDNGRSADVVDNEGAHDINNTRSAVSGKRSEEENEVPNAEEKVSQQIVPSNGATNNARPPLTSKTSTTPVSSSSAPEHMVIAIRLLRAHKAHVDQIMETLKIEMDTLRDFDRLLEEPGRPLEEEVLDYFESVGLCLDQRTQAGATLQKEMDRISRGEPPQN